ncbi:MAG: PilW family protein [Ignavibacteria bacterium]
MRFSAGRNRCQSGFSLVEIMVAVVIGMLGVIVMMQVYALSEERKRTTTSGGDAMTEGITALYALQRDIRQGGFGFANTKLLGCGLELRSGVTLTALAPVTIYPAGAATPLIPAGDADTDALLVVYGNANGSPQGDGITTQPSQTQYAMQTPTAFSANDYVVAAPATRPTPCSLLLDRVGTVTNPNVTVGTGVTGMTNGTLFNLGQSPTVVAYAVRNGNLTMCNYMVNDCSAAANVADTSVWVPIANNIVSLRAQYGKDTTTPSMDGVLDTYNVVQPTSACTWARTSAVRLALVARSAQFEKTAVTAVAPTWDGSAGAAIDLSANAEWQNYRYKVYQTVVPLRNVAWMGAVSGC